MRSPRPHRRGKGCQPRHHEEEGCRRRFRLTGRGSLRPGHAEITLGHRQSRGRGREARRVRSVLGARNPISREVAALCARSGEDPQAAQEERSERAGRRGARGLAAPRRRRGGNPVPDWRRGGLRGRDLRRAVAGHGAARRRSVRLRRLGDPALRDGPQPRCRRSTVSRVAVSERPPRRGLEPDRGPQRRSCQTRQMSLYGTCRHFRA